MDPGAKDASPNLDLGAKNMPSRVSGKEYGSGSMGEKCKSKSGPTGKKSD